MCPAGCSELLSTLLKLTEDEEDLALIIPGQLTKFQFYFRAGMMRKAMLSLTCYLLIGALSPVLHVDGSRTRPGIIVVSRYLFFCPKFSPLWPSTYHFLHLLHCDKSPLITVHCSVHFLSLLFLIAFSSLLFVTSLVAKSRSWSVGWIQNLFACWIRCRFREKVRT